MDKLLVLTFMVLFSVKPSFSQNLMVKIKLIDSDGNFLKHINEGILYSVKKNKDDKKDKYTRERDILDGEVVFPTKLKPGKKIYIDISFKGEKNTPREYTIQNPSESDANTFEYVLIKYISGLVFDEINQINLSKVKVSIRDIKTEKGYQGFTNENGQFLVETKIDNRESFIVSFSKEGYKTTNTGILNGSKLGIIKLPPKKNPILVEKDMNLKKPFLEMAFTGTTFFKKKKKKMLPNIWIYEKDFADKDGFVVATDSLGEFNAELNFSELLALNRDLFVYSPNYLLKKPRKVKSPENVELFFKKNNFFNRLDQPKWYVTLGLLAGSITSFIIADNKYNNYVDDFRDSKLLKSSKGFQCLGYGLSALTGASITLNLLDIIPNKRNKLKLKFTDNNR